MTTPTLDVRPEDYPAAQFRTLSPKRPAHLAESLTISAATFEVHAHLRSDGLPVPDEGAPRQVRRVRPQARPTRGRCVMATEIRSRDAARTPVLAIHKQSDGCADHEAIDALREQDDEAAWERRTER